MILVDIVQSDAHIRSNKQAHSVKELEVWAFEESTLSLISISPLLLGLPADRFDVDRSGSQSDLLAASFSPSANRP